MPTSPGVGGEEVLGIGEWSQSQHPPGTYMLQSPKASTKKALEEENGFIDVVCMAFLYEFLTKDDVDVTATRLNAVIKAVLRAYPNDSNLKARFTDDDGRVKQYDKKDIPAVRNAVGSEEGMDDAVYNKLLTTTTALIGSPGGRQKLTTMIKSRPHVIYEEASDNPAKVVPRIDQKDFKDDAWAMPGVGDLGETYVTGADLLMFCSLVSNTGIVSKGALDKTVNLSLRPHSTPENLRDLVLGLIRGTGDGAEQAQNRIVFNEVYSARPWPIGANAKQIQSKKDIYVAIMTPEARPYLGGVPNLLYKKNGKIIETYLAGTVATKTLTDAEFDAAIREYASKRHSNPHMPYPKKEVKTWELYPGVTVHRDDGDGLGYNSRALHIAGASFTQQRLFFESILGEVRGVGSRFQRLQSHINNIILGKPKTAEGNPLASREWPKWKAYLGPKKGTTDGEFVLGPLAITTFTGVYGAEQDDLGVVKEIKKSFHAPLPEKLAPTLYQIDNGVHSLVRPPWGYFDHNLGRKYFNDLLDGAKGLKPGGLGDWGPSTVQQMMYSAPYIWTDPTTTRYWQRKARAQSPDRFPYGPVYNHVCNRWVEDTITGAWNWKNGTAKGKIGTSLATSTLEGAKYSGGPLPDAGQMESLAGVGTPAAKAALQGSSVGGDTVWVKFDAAKVQGENSVASIAAYTSRIIARIARCYPKKLNELLIDVLADIQGQVTASDKKKGKPTGKYVKRKLPSIDIKGLQATDLQCFLLENIRKLTALQDQNVLDYPYENLGAMVDPRLKTLSMAPAHIRGAVGPPVNPGNIISYINHGGPEKTPQTEALLNLCPDAYALLTPYIKVYRVDYKDEDTLTPYRELEIPFPSFIDPNDISQITQGNYGRYKGAGIQSFSWQLDGVNPAEVENNISAELKLRFQTLYDLFSLNQSLQAGDSSGAGYLDLIIGSGTSFRKKAVEAPEKHPRSSCHEAASEGYEGERFRIKVCVGWATPPGFGNMSFRNFRQPMGEGSETYGQFLERAINESRTALYLQVTGHNLNFNEDGAVELQISYQASLAGILKAPNADIFIGGAEFDEKIKEYQESIKKFDKETNEYLEAELGKGEVDDKALTAIEDESIKKRESLDKLLKRNRAQKYKRFLCNLYENSKIYMLDVPSKELVNYSDLTPEQRAALARRRQKRNPLVSGIGHPQLASDKQYGKIIRQSHLAIKGAFKDRPSNSKDATPDIVRSLWGVKGRRKKGNPDTLSIPYFYLGDLLDGILGYLKNIIVDENGLNGSFQMILSNIEILDPLMAFQVKDVRVQCGSDPLSGEVIRTLAEIDPLRFRGANKLSFYTNIGSIPISLDYFQEWFVNHIVRRQLESYSFLSFVKQICSALIGKAFNSKCFDEALNYNLRFDTGIFGLDTSFTGMTMGPDSLAEAKSAADRRAQLPLNRDFDEKPTIPSIVLYSRDSKPAVSQDEKENIGNGIYQYYLGASCGLAKKISFHKSDMPYYRESRLQRKGALSAVQLRELYNVNIDMIGNTLHRNGQYVKVDPTAVGIGRVESEGTLPNLAQLLGIGGYYLISKVSHTISSTGFDVSVTGLQEGLNFGDDRLVEINQYEANEPGETPKDKPSKGKGKKKK